VGPSVAEQLAGYGLRADVIPDQQYSAASLVELLVKQVSGQHWLVTTTNRSGDTLERGLLAAGAQVTTCLTYQSVPLQRPGPALVAAAASGNLRYVLVSSGAIAEGVAKMLSQMPNDATAVVKPIALGQQTAEALRELGLPAVAVSHSNSVRSLIDALVGYHQVATNKI
jgi:uroporphyrinogen-III synthase